MCGSERCPAHLMEGPKLQVRRTDQILRQHKCNGITWGTKWPRRSCRCMKAELSFCNGELGGNWRAHLPHR